jgi:hypothetical protein
MRALRHGQQESAMYGEITKFHEDLGIGVIEAEDGSKYRFDKSEIVSSARKLIGEHVDFLVDARRPRQIIVMSGSAWGAFGGICERAAANDR